jgi:ferredoxin
MRQAAPIVRRDLCIGSENCLRLAPDVFDSDEEGLVVLRLAVVPVDRAAVNAAIDACPVDALSWSDTS